MSIQVSWDDADKAIVIFTFDGHWGWEEFYEAIEQSNALMATVSYPVDAIIDLRHSPLIPRNMLSHLTRMPKISHPNTNGIVVVGASGLVQALTNFYIQVYGTSERKFRLVHTLEAAREYLRAEASDKA